MINMLGEGDVTLAISDCHQPYHGSALISDCVGVGRSDKTINGGGGMYFYVTVKSTITIRNTQFLENLGHSVGEILFYLTRNGSTFIHIELNYCK